MSEFAQLLVCSFHVTFGRLTKRFIKVITPHLEPVLCQHDSFRAMLVHELQDEILCVEIVSGEVEHSPSYKRYQRGKRSKLKQAFLVKMLKSVGDFRIMRVSNQ